ncbi:MAG: ComEC/Rec2 family competence protein [Clostridia bacterium]|nr:ComEC/Rec2 family competence protein [Clostridia bacterium]
MKRPFAVIGFTVFFTIALLIDTETGVTAAALVAYAAALVVALLIRKLREQRVFPCAFASGAVACALLLATVNYSYLPVAALDGKICDLTAVLTSEPEIEYGNYYYMANACSVDGEAVDFKLRLTFSSHPDAEPYDEISGKFSFYIPGSSSKDALNSYKSNGIFIAAYPNYDNFSVISIPDSEKPIGKRIIDIRNAIENAVYRVLPDERGSLAVALITGTKSGLSPDILNDFRIAGISHIICVSGFHISLWSMLVYGLLKKLRAGERISSILSAFAVIAFMLITGMTYSVVRSGIMMLIYFLSNVIFRKRDSANSLGFALIAIALFNPFAMGSVSLQLSALATFGIILYSQCFAPRFESAFSKIKIRYVRSALHSIFTTFMLTAAATAFTFPVSLSIYNSFNFITFFANIVAVPVSSLCMILCAAGAAIGCISASIFNLPAFLGGLLSDSLIRFAGFAADIDLFSFRISGDESAIIVCAVMMICIFSLLMVYYGKSMPYLTACVCTLVFTVSLLFFSFNGQRGTKINVVDCGNGTSVVASSGGENLIIGCGGTEFLGGMRVSNAVQSVGGNTDFLIVPDSDESSSGYLNDVLPELRPDRIFFENLPQGSKFLLKNTEQNILKDTFSCENFTVKYHKYKNKSCVNVKNQDISILICFDPIEDISSLPKEFLSADVMITRNDYPAGTEELECDFIVINAENERGVILQNELSALGVNCAATAGCGNIIIKADDGFISAFREP